MTRREKALLIAIPVLLAVAVIANWGNIVSIARGRKTLREIILGKPIQVPSPSKEQIGEIKPVGPKDAKVKVTAYIIFTNPCHWGTVEVLRRLASKYPGKVRAEFVNMGTEEGARKFAEASKTGFKSGHPTHSCMAWVAVNGKFEWDVEYKGKKRHITFSGAVHPGDPMAEMLESVIKREIERAYGKGAGKGREQKGRLSPKGGPAHKGPLGRKERGPS